MDQTKVPVLTYPYGAEMARGAKRQDLMLALCTRAHSPPPLLQQSQQ